MASLQDYEKLLAPARRNFAESFAVRALQQNTDSALCELFLMYFCALGAHMTEPVESWIRRAAARSARMGLSRLARKLRSHAAAEANHHLLMIADLRSIAARWNERNSPPIDPDALLGRGLTAGVINYRRLHEDIIDGETPFAQIAIEYEIEMLPLRFGDLVLARCIELLGTDILSSLSFITQHIALDGAHTDLNAQMLTELLEQAPWSLPAAAKAGISALDAYASFLGDCVRLAGEHLRRADVRVAPPHRSTRIQIAAPPHAVLPDAAEFSCPDWLAEVRSLRARVLFDHGRRPAFRTVRGVASDADPIDLHAYHLLAYASDRLIGCVRLYRLDPEGPPCVAEEVLGRDRFAEMLRNLHAAHGDIVEIGRWVVEPEYRAATHDLGVSIQLAAASAALAGEIGCAAGKRDGYAICAAGVADRQCAMLKRLGMTPIPGVGAAWCARYQDEVQILCCSQEQRLHPQFSRLVDLMAERIGLDGMFVQAFRRDPGRSERKGSSQPSAEPRHA
jgi:hypothetical protein